VDREQRQMLEQEKDQREQSLTRRNNLVSICNLKVAEYSAVTINFSKFYRKKVG
jgi:hypothetical protein